MTKNIAHRGFSGRFPENTLLAFQKAIEVGADGNEFDVHLTRDGVPVIHHDENLERTTNGTGLIGDFTFDELRQLDASARYAGLSAVQRIPSLREYFELINGIIIISNIELKTGIIHYPEIEQRVLALIDEFHYRENVIVSSFNHYSARLFKTLAPDVRIGILEESWLIDPVGYAKSIGAECYHPEFHSLTEEIVQNFRENQIKINAWTINEETDMRKSIEMRLDGVITNHPDKFAHILKESQTI